MPMRSALPIALAVSVLALSLGEIFVRAKKPGGLTNPDLCRYLPCDSNPWTNLRRTPATPARWCDLGDILSAPKTAALARYCFERAVKLGPRIPPVLIRAANYSFGAGNYPQALGDTRKVLELTPRYDAIVFSYYRRMGVPIAEVMSTGLPGSARALQSYFRHLMSWAPPGEIELVWKAVAKSSPLEELTNRYLRYLVGRKLYDKAVTTWSDYLGKIRGGYPYSEFLYNGGFERKLSGSPLDWHLRHVPGVVSQRVPGGRDGGEALKLEFAGTYNIDSVLASEAVPLPAGVYRFTAWMRSRRLTTDQGIYFRLRGPGIDVRTGKLTGSHDWTKLVRQLTVRARTALVRVQLCRDESLQIDSKIRGTVWVDDVKLEKVKPLAVASRK